MQSWHIASCFSEGSEYTQGIGRAPVKRKPAFVASRGTSFWRCVQKCESLAGASTRQYHHSVLTAEMKGHTHTFDRYYICCGGGGGWESQGQRLSQKGCTMTGQAPMLHRRTESSCCATSISSNGTAHRRIDHNVVRYLLAVAFKHGSRYGARFEQYISDLIPPPRMPSLTNLLHSHTVCIDGNFIKFGSCSSTVEA